MSARDPEWRAETEAFEELAARQVLRNRRLSDAALELLHRGDVVAVGGAGRRFTGTVVHAAGDLLCLRTAAGDVDLRAPATAAWSVLERRPGGGTGRAGGPASFKARLFEHEAVGAVLEFGVQALDESVVGRLAAVAVDHVVVDDHDRQRWYLPLAALVWVRAR